MSKGEENVTGMIFVIGILVVTLLTVGIGLSMFSGVKLPLSDDQRVSEDSTAGDLAGYADRCWRQGGQGSSNQRIDCFTVEINSTEDLNRDIVNDSLEELPRDRFLIKSDVIGKKDIVSKVSYLPDEKVVEVSLLRNN